MTASGAGSLSDSADDAAPSGSAETAASAERIASGAAEIFSGAAAFCETGFLSGRGAGSPVTAE